MMTTTLYSPLWSWRKVKVISRLAQWRIPDLNFKFRLQSDAFDVGFWQWHLEVSRSTTSFQIALSPEHNSAFDENTPSATFVLSVFPADDPGRPLKKTAHDHVFKSVHDVFVWKLPSTHLISRPFVVDVEFLDLKIWSTDDDVDHPPISGWPSHDEELESHNPQHSVALGCLSRMLTEGLHSDVTIITPNGSLRAHKAVLVAASPVFESMLACECKEKHTSTIEMTDISLDSCCVLLRYIYGTLTPEEMWNHRVDLLVSADKYFVDGDLKACCEESLMEDVISDNVLERLFLACTYGLERLERHCWTYLVDFQKMHQVRASREEVVERLLGERISKTTRE